MLDTSVAVAMREGDIRIIRRSAELTSAALLSILSVVELEGGVPAAAEGAAVRRIKLDELYNAVDILSFDRAEADAYRSIVAACGYSRSAIIDRMIAAQAIVAQAAVATLNSRDFRGIPDLRFQDWS